MSNSDDSQQNVRINLSNSTSDTMFRPSPTTCETVTPIIKHMKNTSSQGSDGISLHYMKDSLPSSHHHLPYYILNTSIVTGILPKALKHSVVVPVFKSGNQYEPQNDHSKSCLPVISKILEK